MVESEIRRIAIFASVSSPQQASIEKDSLPAQVRDGRAWAASVGGEVVAVYRVPGHSRKFIFYADAAREMLAYRQLRADAESGAFDVVWCRARDRLGRTDALISQVEAVISAIGGAQVYSALMPTALGAATDASGLYISAIERAQAQVENLQKSQRHRIGMRKRVERGLHPSNWPLGYRAVRDDGGRCVGAEVVPDEAETVRFVTDMFLRGYGYLQIANALVASPHHTRNGGGWHVNTVRRITMRDLYAGVVACGEFAADEPSDKFPALWDEATYRAVVRERERRHRGGHAPVSPVSGLVFCVRCGWRMAATGGSKRPRSFRCVKHANKSLYGACHPNHVKVAVVETAVERALAAAATDADVTATVAQSAHGYAQLRQEVAQAAHAAQAVRQKRRRLALALADGKMMADVYRTADDTLIEEQRIVTATLADAQARAARLPSVEEREASLRQLRDLTLEHGASGWLRAAPVEEMRTLLREIGVEVWCEERKIVRIVV